MFNIVCSVLMLPFSGHCAFLCFLFLSILHEMMHVITAIVTPKMRKRPPTAVGMVTRRTVVPGSLTVGVVSVVTVMLMLGTSELLTVVLLFSGSMTAASAE